MFSLFHRKPKCSVEKDTLLPNTLLPTDIEQLPLKMWFLTWGDGTNKTIIAPTSNTAITLAGKGAPLSIHEIGPYDKLLLIRNTLASLQECVDRLTNLINDVAREVPECK